MKRRSFLGALTAASLGVVVDGSVTKFARAQNTAQAAANSQASKTSRFPPNAAIILVHGAWADGSCRATSFRLCKSAVFTSSARRSR